MKIPYRWKRRLSLIIICIGLPAYILAAVTIIGLFERPSTLVELAVYALLGVAWALPFRALFKGIGRGPPDGEGD